MDSPPPFVRVVVLNFDGGSMTLDCLDSLLSSDWPTDRFEIVMVDNGSVDDVVERVAADPRYASVRVLEPLANLGFAGGCNLGMRADGEYDLVALVNNDATVDPGWLRALHGAMAVDDRIGAVCAKMLFADRYHVVDLEVPAARRIGSDPRLLGVRVVGVRLDDERVDERLAFDEAMHGPEAPVEDEGEEIARWTSDRGSIRIAAREERPRSIALRLSSISPVTAVVRTAVDRQEVEVDRSPVWVRVSIEAEPVDIINNVGSALYPGGFGGDRGFLEIDCGQYDEPAEVFAWCGGAVLLRREYLDAVGMFDERLFLYYEDTDLSWRGRIQGWRYVYEPRALVRHRHSASSGGAGSPVFRFHTERNRLLVLAKDAPAPLALRAGLGEVRRGVMVVVRHYVIRPLTLRLPVRAEVSHRLRVLRSYLSLLPEMLRDRRAMRVVVPREELMSWEITK